MTFVSQFYNVGCDNSVSCVVIGYRQLIKSCCLLRVFTTVVQSLWDGSSISNQCLVMLNIVTFFAVLLIKSGSRNYLPQDVLLLAASH